MPKIAVALSGGVDSTLSVALLKEQGHEVTGVFFKLWQTDLNNSNLDRAKQVALQLKVPFKVIDLSLKHKKLIVDYLIDAYQKGSTPNPCVKCNQQIKFGLFFDWVIKNNFDFLATGHYAQIKNNQLIIAKDKNKDQTYFLHLLTGEKLKNIIFPIGNLLKTEVRKKAQKLNLKNHSLKDSENICFLKNSTLKKFLLKNLGEKKGSIVDKKGNILGQHSGLWFYTIGQRTGFTIDKRRLALIHNLDKTKIPALYVTDKITKTNELVIGFAKDALKNKFKVKNLHWINSEQIPDKNLELFVRIRHQGQLTECQLNDNLVLLKTKLKGISSGQSAVFYQKINLNNYICLGGGVINY